MEKQMSSRFKVGIILTIIATVTVVTALWALVALHEPQFLVRRAPPPGGFVPGDFEYFYIAFTIISTLNIALLVIVLISYLGIYNKTRSPFTVGLIIFAAAFLLKDIASHPFVTGLFRFNAYGLGPFAFLPGVFELAALSVLLYLSVKY
jgi:hypothetical protein